MKLWYVTFVVWSFRVFTFITAQQFGLCSTFKISQPLFVRNQVFLGLIHDLINVMIEGNMSCLKKNIAHKSMEHTRHFMKWSELPTLMYRTTSRFWTIKATYINEARSKDLRSAKGCGRQRHIKTEGIRSTEHTISRHRQRFIEWQTIAYPKIIRRKLNVHQDWGRLWKIQNQLCDKSEQAWEPVLWSEGDGW
jgi:hypothetical protein